MSRRKPNITRKRGGESDDMEESEGGMMEEEEEEEEMSDEGEAASPVPEGTIVVQPEGVDERRHDVESSASKQSLGLLSSPIQCTACHGYIPVVRRDSVRSHPVLGVLVCRKCYMTHTTLKIEAGEDGLDESCRWCAEGGDLICCDFCHHAFCKICIRRNLGRTALNDILNADDEVKWRCYVCDPAPLKKLINTCAKVLTETATLPQTSTSSTGTVKRTPKVKKTSSSVKVSESPVEPEEEEENEEEEEEISEHATPQKSPALSATAHLVAAREIASSRGKAKPGGGSVGKRGGKSKVASRADSILQQDNIIYIRTPIGSIVGILAKRLTEELKVPESGNGKAAVPVVTALLLSLDENNIWNVLEKLLAATQSMGMLLSSLKDDLRRSGNGWTDGAAVSPATVEQTRKRKEVATKLWRAFVAYKKSFHDIENFSRNTGPNVASKSESQARVAQEPGADGGAVVEQKAVVKKREAGSGEASPQAKKVKLSEDPVVSSVQSSEFHQIQFEPLFKIDSQ